MDPALVFLVVMTLAAFAVGIGLIILSPFVRRKVFFKAGLAFWALSLAFAFGTAAAWLFGTQLVSALPVPAI